jgi:hypothetical protein
MRGWVSSGLHVDGDGDLLRATFVADPAAWLPPPALALDRQRWLVGVRWGAGDRSVACQMAPCRNGGPAGWRHLVWDVDARRGSDRAPPHLEGELGLLVPSGGSGRGAELTFSGTYVPPFGVLGVAGETAALHEATAAAVRGFLGDLAAGLAAAGTARPTEGSRT